MSSNASADTKALPVQPPAHPNPALTKTILYVFGSGLNGQIPNFGFKSTPHPQPIDDLPEPTVIASCASNSAFVSTKRGEVYSFGRNESFVLGSSSNLDSSTPYQVPLPPVKQITVAPTHAAAIGEDDQVYTWGSRALGRGVSETSLSPLEKSTPTRIMIPAGPNSSNLDGRFDMPKLAKPTSLAAGCNHTLVSMSNGTVWGWGSDVDGALGLNTGDKRKNYEVPTEILMPFGEKISQVVAGQRHSFFKTDNGDLYACGDNALGQTGVPSGSRWIKEPHQVVFPKNSTLVDGKCLMSDVKVDQISAGPTHSCIVSTDKNLYCWGNNANGQLGLALQPEVNKSVGKMLRPVKNTFFDDKNIKIQSVSCGGTHTAVIDTDNKLWMFGNGREGQLSNAYPSPLTSAHNDTPVLISLPGFKPTQVELGNATTYVLGEQIQDE